MSKKENPKDSTTDFFLKFITRQREQRNSDKEPKKPDSTKKKTENRTYELLLKGVNNINILVDKMLSSKVSVLILSFILTIILVFVINGGSINSVLSSPTSGERLTEVPVSVEGLNNDFDVTGIPDTVDVVLLGPTFDIYTTKVSKNYEVYIDLSNYGEGEYSVEYKVRNFSSALDVFVAPGKANVKISQKETRTFDLGYHYENANDLSSDQSLSILSMEHKQVEVRGSQDLLDKIYRVDAVIDYRSIPSQQGPFTFKANIEAYDRSNRRVDVEVIPQEVQIDCEFSWYSKEVNIVPNIVGKAQAGFAVSSVDFNQQKVRIYGDEERLKSIREVRATIDITDYNSNQNQSHIPLELVEGINRMYLSSTSDTIHMDTESNVEIGEIPITVTNNPQNYKVQFRSSNMAKVRLIGASSLLQSIQPSDLQAFIDLDALVPGNKEVPVQVQSSNSLLRCVVISRPKVLINIER